MSPSFRRRRRHEPEAEPPGQEAEHPPKEQDPSSFDRSTLFDVRRAQVPDDSPAWQGSWQRLSDKVHAFLHRRMAHSRLPHDVEFDDLFSSVLACMVRDLPRLKIESREEFWAWVGKVALHQVVNFWRHHDAQRRGGGQVVQQQVDDEDVDVIESARDPAAHPASMIMRIHELEEAERECLERLRREESRKVYVLRRKWRLSYEEIAKHLGGGTAESTRLTFQRAKAKVQACLRHKLDGYEPGPEG